MFRPPLLGRRAVDARPARSPRRRPGGSTWAFEWNAGTRDEEEEEGYRFGDHAFRVGEYVSVREEDGELLTFRVVSVGKP